MDVQKQQGGSAFGSDIKQQVIEFLHQHLGEFRDPKDQIAKALQYAESENGGGQLYLTRENNALIGAVLVLNTGMGGFVPPYLLVYIAVHSDKRGQGIGAKLMAHVKKDLNDAIALHVEHDNPAKRLYLREGFTNKYTEMRWQP